VTDQLTLTDEQVAVMRKTLEHIFAHPAEWNQRYWATQTPCGTAYCFAGHAAVTVAGARPTGDATMAVYVDEFNTQHISDAGQQVLGLDGARADHLFRATNSARRLAELCYLYSDGRVDLLHAVPTPPIPVDVEREATQCEYAYANYHELRRTAEHHGIDVVEAARRVYDERSPLTAWPS
jgi:hypothetical protein